MVALVLLKPDNTVDGVFTCNEDDLKKKGKGYIRKMKKAAEKAGARLVDIKCDTLADMETYLSTIDDLY